MYYKDQCDGGEVPLPAHGACLLGSMNLVKFVKEVDGKWVFDYTDFAKKVALAVEFLDKVIDVSDYPLPEQEQEMKSKRRIGLGITGLANALERMGYDYGSQEFLAELATIMESLRDAAYIESIRLAKEYGAFPLCDTTKHLQGQYVQQLPLAIQSLIAVYGIRNSHLLSIAPTGTISLCADNVSSGIEPVFTHEYHRDIITPDGKVTEPVQDYAYAQWGIKGKTALEISPDTHLAVQALCQSYVDQAISKTINLGKQITFDEFKDVYLKAYQLNCKGTTTFYMGGQKTALFTVEEESETEFAACTFDPTTGQKSCS